MTPLDRLKLARDDFDQQEKLYNTLMLGVRFYVGTLALVGGWSLSLFPINGFSTDWRTACLLLSGMLFWGSLVYAFYHLFQLFRGDHWTIPRTLDHYTDWEQARLKQLHGGDFDLDGKTPEDFAEDEMLRQMTGAYADSACINREGNLARQRRVTKVGKTLLLAVLFLGLQGVARMMYTQHHVQQTNRPAKATDPAAAGSGGHDKPQ